MQRTLSHRKIIKYTVSLHGAEFYCAVYSCSLECSKQETKQPECVMPFGYSPQIDALHLIRWSNGPTVRRSPHITSMCSRKPRVRLPVRLFLLRPTTYLMFFHRLSHVIMCLLVCNSLVRKWNHFCESTVRSDVSMEL